jgi:hypothetical protein
MDLVNQYQTVKGSKKGEKRGSAVKYDNLAVPPAITDKSIN